MTGTGRAFRVAVIGGGPRGLAACEALVAQVRKGQRLALTVFEPCRTPGAGPHHDPGQTSLNRLNIPLREIDLPRPPVGQIGDFADWAAVALPECRADDFPVRAELGRYLEARWASLCAHLPAGVSLRVIGHQVTRAEPGATGWTLQAGPARHGPFDAVALCVGHQPVRPDEQIRRWRDHAARCGATLMHAYPSDALGAAVENWRDRTVAIRGLALSMIDVMRTLTVGLGGRFEAAGSPGRLRYHRSGREPRRIVPFSLNGIPPAPKPADGRLDAGYDLHADEIGVFRAALSQAVSLRPEQAMDELAAALAQVAAGVMSRLGVTGGAAAAEDWIRIERGEASGEHAAMEQPPAESLARHLDMALGHRAPSVGYLIGQVWRKIQDPLRDAFGAAQVAPETAAALVGFDEGLKRYSYGPPARSAAEMLALIEDGLLDLRAVEDPSVQMIEGGWRLSADEGEATVSVMIDAVLASPVLEACTAPLLVDLRANGLLVPVVEGLGARTSVAGQALDARGKPVPGLFLLGRLALGSVIAADSVNDCFGSATAHWAEHVAQQALDGADARQQVAR